MLQGEDYFLDSLPQTQRDAAWQCLAEQCAAVDLFIAPSRYFGELMGKRLHLPADRVLVVYNGINLDGYQPSEPTPGPSQEGSTGSHAPDRFPSVEGSGVGTLGRSSVLSRAGRLATDNGQRTVPVLGYFARMCPEKGLDRLVEAFVLLKGREGTQQLKLRVGGSLGPSDESFVDELRARLKALGLLGDVEFCPNLDRTAKQAFLRSLTLFCVPALYGEAFGLYVIEAMASGVPVVQPRVAAFPELIDRTGGGVLYEAADAAALADAVERLLSDPDRLRELGESGRKAVRQEFTAGRMAENIVRAFEQALGRPWARQPANPKFQIPNPG